MIPAQRPALVDHSHPALVQFVEKASDQALVFWQHARSVAIPDSTWTPMPWGLRWNTEPADEDWLGTFADASTTIAAGSDTAVLPQATINVASTSGFLSAGYLTITGPPGTDIDTVVSYTGSTGTTFTGCNSSYLGSGVGISTGTLATGQTVRQAAVEFFTPDAGLAALIGEVAWADDATATGIRGIRTRATGSPFFFAGATKTEKAFSASDPKHHMQTAEQPGGASGARMEVYQSSGGVLNTVTVSFAAPRLVVAKLSYDAI